MLPAKLPLKQLQVIWHSMINSIIHQRWSGKCYCLLPKYLYLTCTWLKKYLMSSKYSEYLNLYLQIWKSTCTWLKYFKKYLTPTLIKLRFEKKGLLFDQTESRNHWKNIECKRPELNVHHLELEITNLLNFYLLILLLTCWLSWWTGADEAISHCLNECWQRFKMIYMYNGTMY